MANDGFSGRVIGAVITTVIFTTVGLIAADAAIAADPANWGAAGAALMVLVPLVMVTGLVFYLLKEFGILKGRNG